MRSDRGFVPAHLWPNAAARPTPGDWIFRQGETLYCGEKPVVPGPLALASAVEVEPGDLVSFRWWEAVGTGVVGPGPEGPALIEGHEPAAYDGVWETLDPDGTDHHSLMAYFDVWPGGAVGVEFYLTRALECRVTSDGVELPADWIEHPVD